VSYEPSIVRDLTPYTGSIVLNMDSCMLHVRNEYTYVPNSPSYSKRFEHGLLHVHVRAASRASSAFLPGAAIHARTYRSISFCFPFRHHCSCIRIEVVLEGTCTYMLAHCSACMQKILPCRANELDTSSLHCIRRPK
jgi:hypothetical protein